MVGIQKGLHTTCRVDIIGVVERQVVIPDRACEEFLLPALLIHIYAPEGIGIAHQFAYDEVTQEALEVEVFAVALRLVVEVLGENGSLHLVEIVRNVGILGIAFVGVI